MSLNQPTNPPAASFAAPVTARRSVSAEVGRRWVCQCPGIFRPGTLKELIVAGPGTGFG